MEALVVHRWSVGLNGHVMSAVKIFRHICSEKAAVSTKKGILMACMNESRRPPAPVYMYATSSATEAMSNLVRYGKRIILCHLQESWKPHSKHTLKPPGDIHVEESEDCDDGAEYGCNYTLRGEGPGRRIGRVVRVCCGVEIHFVIREW